MDICSVAFGYSLVSVAYAMVAFSLNLISFGRSLAQQLLQSGRVHSIQMAQFPSHGSISRSLDARTPFAELQMNR